MALVAISRRERAGRADVSRAAPPGAEVRERVGGITASRAGGRVGESRPAGITDHLDHATGSPGEALNVELTGAVAVGAEKAGQSRASPRLRAGRPRVTIDLAVPRFV